MKEISKTQWNRYKNSDEGKKAIELFGSMLSPDTTYDDMYELARKYDPAFFANLGKKDRENIMFVLGEFEKVICQKHVESPEDYEALYLDILECLAQPTEDEIIKLDDLPQSSFKYLLSDNLFLSIILYVYYPEFFMPNLFVMQFLYLKRFAEKYDIELPPIPKRSDYLGRCKYYLELCKIFVDFSNINSLRAHELCAYIYDYELPVIKEELENEDKSEMPEYPRQAWILVGNYGEAEKDMKYGFWQANEFTEKGDLMLFYEKSPVKKMNAIWIAQEKGIVDPFFFYYSNTYIGNKISIPDNQAISFADFKNSEYFKNRDKKGNFVSKNFQDVSGWPVTTDDYKEIKRMLNEKGFDVGVLPCLYEPTKIGDFQIELENDVSEKLLIPLLEQMGWKNYIDFKREVEFHAGRGKTGFSSDKRPDFCLHISEKNGDIEARVIIEVKKYLKNDKEIHDNFIQGRSYAKWGNAQTLVLCDEKKILVYQRDNNYSFTENKFIKFSWNDMETNEKYNELKKLLL